MTKIPEDIARKINGSPIEVDRDEVKQLIRKNWETILAREYGVAKGKTSSGAPTYICPICKNGSGEHGTGIHLNPNNKFDKLSLKCFRCKESGDIIHFWMKAHNMDTSKGSKDFPRAIEQLAEIIGVKPMSNGKNYRVEDPSDVFIDEDKAEQAVETNVEEERAKVRHDMNEARKNINKPIAREWLKKRGLGENEDIFSDKYGIGFLEYWKTYYRPSIIVPTCSPDDEHPSYFIRDLRTDADLEIFSDEAKEQVKRHAKKHIKAKGDSRGFFNFDAVKNQGDGAVFVVEGEIDALSLISAGCDATALGSVDMIKRFVDAIDPMLSDGPLVVALDNDETGQKSQKELLKLLRAKGVRAIGWNVAGKFKDVNERLMSGELAGIVKDSQEAEREALKLEPIPDAPIKENESDIDETSESDAQASDSQSESSTEKKDSTALLGLTWGDDFCSDLTADNWLVDKWLPSGELSMIFGDPGSGKSFLAVDWAMSLATGSEDWNGYDIKPRDEDGAIVYLAGEGHAGLKKRLVAWLQNRNELVAENCRENGLVAPPPMELSYLHGRLAISRTAANFSSVEDSRQVLEELRALRAQSLGKKLDLIFVDTLLCFMGGDENSSKDAREVINFCNKIQNEFKAAVCLVHHSGVALENKDRSRGSSAWLGALQTQIKVEYDDKSRQIVVSQKKQKDIPLEKLMRLEYKQILLEQYGIGDSLEPIRSAVLVKTETEEEKKEIEEKTRKKSDEELVASALAAIKPKKTS